MNVISGVFLAIIIVCSAFLIIALSESWFMKQFEEKRIYEKVDKRIADETISSIIKFLKSNKKNEDRNTESLKQNLTEKEISHLKNVRNIISSVKYTAIISLIFFLLGCIYIFRRLDIKKNPNAIQKILFSSGIFIIIFLLLLGLPFIINFDSSFIIMHNILFPMGNWAFNPDTYMLTRILTEDVFSSFTFHFVGLLIFFAFLLIIFGFLLKKTPQQSL